MPNEVHSDNPAQAGLSECTSHNVPWFTFAPGFNPRTWSGLRHRNGYIRNGNFLQLGLSALGIETGNILLN